MPGAIGRLRKKEKFNEKKNHTQIQSKKRSANEVRVWCGFLDFFSLLFVPHFKRVFTFIQHLPKRNYSFLFS